MARLPGSGIWTLGTFWGAGCLLVSPLILQQPQKALQPVFSSSLGLLLSLTAKGIQSSLGGTDCQGTPLSLHRSC